MQLKQLTHAVDQKTDTTWDSDRNLLRPEVMSTCGLEVNQQRRINSSPEAFANS
jgi:hypothetical protein